MDVFVSVTTIPLLLRDFNSIIWHSLYFFIIIYKYICYQNISCNQMVNLKPNLKMFGDYVMILTMTEHYAIAIMELSINWIDLINMVLIEMESLSLQLPWSFSILLFCASTLICWNHLNLVQWNTWNFIKHLIL